MGSLFSRFRVHTTVVPEALDEGYQADFEDSSTSASSLDHVNHPPLSPMKKSSQRLLKTPAVPNFFDNIVMDSTF